MPRILVADDNSNIQKMVALAFQDRGVDVTSVGNGEAAVRRLPEINPDLILADIFMPVRNGYELCEWVKKDTKFSHIPVILLVGAFDPLDEKEARRVGADGVLKKPFIPPDPLIAMVTAVLEKGSKGLVEEISAKEATPAPQPLPAAVAPPARIEVAPAPEFPEPSAEDASLAYGFGSGRRALEDEGSAEFAEPPAPVAEADGAQEEFEGASTTKDWRRSAMEFEIPEETSRRPAFSVEDEAHPALALEKTTAGTHLPVPQAESESQPADPRNVRAEVPAPSGQSDPADEAPESVNAWSDPAQASAQTAEVMSPESLVHESPANAQTSFASKAAHWMDLMASSGKQPRSDWFTSTFGSRSHSGNQGSPMDSAASSPAAVAQETPAEAESATETPAAPGQQTAPSAGEESFFAEEEEASGSILDTAAAPEPEAAAEQAEAHAAAEIEEGPSFDGPAIEAHFSESEAAEEHLAGPVGEETFTAREEAVKVSLEPAELLSEADDEPVLAKDPNLVEPPAVHVTPEPLLIDESPNESLTYAAREQETAPLYSFLSAKPQASPEAADEPAAAAGDENDNHKEEFSLKAEENRDETSRLEFSSLEFDTPVHATPIPAREALAHIPFLNPPPDFRQGDFDSDNRQNREAEPAAAVPVDVIVQKVLERLEPQIRELLSQNVLKPLVENLLKQEIEKKNP